MANLIIISWRDIPAQVIVKRARETAKVQLSQRFQEAVDHADPILCSTPTHDQTRCAAEHVPNSVDGIFMSAKGQRHERSAPIDPAELSDRGLRSLSQASAAYCCVI